MAEHPLKIFEKLDPELLNLVENTRELALADGIGSGSYPSWCHQRRDHRGAESCAIR
jgi:hypothetical protein